MDITSTAYLSFLHPLPFRRDRARKFQAAIEDLCSLSDKLTLSLDSYDIEKTTFRIRALEPSSTEEEQAREYLAISTSIRELARPSPRITMIVEFSLEATIAKDFAEMSDDGGTVTRYEGEEAEALYSTEIESVLASYVHRIIVAANIAHVGSLASNKSVVVSKNRLSDIEATSNAQSLEEATEYALSIGWPSIKTLKISEVWEWASAQKGFMEGFGGGPTGRALNALTHLLRPVGIIDEGTELFWSLVGIEALYTKGSSGIQEQVREKSQLLLGPQDSYKKEITRMYDLRSRFVHGDLNFSGAHPSEAIGEYAHEQNQQLIKSVNLARAMLVSTLQILVTNGWTEPRFYYQVEGSSETQ